MIPSSVRIFLCPEPIDMRYGFDRLVHLCRQRLGQDPVLGGAVFVFVGRTSTRLKLLLPSRWASAASSGERCL